MILLFEIDVRSYEPSSQIPGDIERTYTILDAIDHSTRTGRWDQSDEFLTY
jgi:hypothetical protein